MCAGVGLCTAALGPQEFQIREQLKFSQRPPQLSLYIAVTCKILLNYPNHPKHLGNLSLNNSPEKKNPNQEQ